MTSEANSPIEGRAERLLSALAGVVSARAVSDETGRLVEIHILASPELHPKQVVRNVESALSAGLGIVVDRRIISVAQLRPNTTAAERPSPRRAAQNGGKNGARRSWSRVVFVQFDSASRAPLDSSCRVVLQRGERQLTGTGTGLNTPQGRAEAAARAVFQALRGTDEASALGLEGTTLVEAHGRTYVLVAARAMAGRNSRTLTGIADLHRSPEEAGILAALQATNRIEAP